MEENWYGSSPILDNGLVSANSIADFRSIGVVEPASPLPKMLDLSELRALNKLPIGVVS